MRRPGLVVGFVILVGLAGTIVALASRSSDTQFIAQQQDLVPVSTTALQRLLLTTSDPRPHSSHGRARAARCSSSGTGEFRNPWRCSVTYPTRPALRYAVTVHTDRSITGRSSPYIVAGHSAGAFTVSGCCVAFGP